MPFLQTTVIPIQFNQDLAGASGNQYTAAIDVHAYTKGSIYLPSTFNACNMQAYLGAPPISAANFMVLGGWLTAMVASRTYTVATPIADALQIRFFCSVAQDPTVTMYLMLKQ